MKKRLKEILLQAGALPYLMLSIVCYVVAAGFYTAGQMGTRLLHWAPVVTFATVGTVMLAAVLVFMAVGFWPVLKGRRLKNLGIYVWARVTKFEGPSGGGFRAVMTRSHVVWCSAVLEGKNREFKSCRVYTDPNVRRGQKVQVWFDESNVEKYYVDVGKYLR
jgi:hypothetical protein